MQTGTNWGIDLCSFLASFWMVTKAWKVDCRGMAWDVNAESPLQLGDSENKKTISNWAQKIWKKNIFWNKFEKLLNKTYSKTSTRTGWFQHLGHRNCLIQSSLEIRTDGMSTFSPGTFRKFVIGYGWTTWPFKYQLNYQLHHVWKSGWKGMDSCTLSLRRFKKPIGNHQLTSKPGTCDFFDIDMKKTPYLLLMGYSTAPYHVSSLRMESSEHQCWLTAKGGRSCSGDILRSLWLWLRVIVTRPWIWPPCPNHTEPQRVRPDRISIVFLPMRIKLSQGSFNTMMRSFFLGATFMTFLVHGRPGQRQGWHVWRRGPRVWCGFHVVRTMAMNCGVYIDFAISIVVAKMNPALIESSWVGHAMVDATTSFPTTTSCMVFGC